jgi:hypothetical protein
MGVPTIVLARTDAEAANLITSDHDANDKPFLTGERTQEGFYRVKNGLEQAISRGVAYAPYADLVWCETGKPDLAFAKAFADAIHAQFPGHGRGPHARQVVGAGPGQRLRGAQGGDGAPAWCGVSPAGLSGHGHAHIVAPAGRPLGGDNARDS